MLKNTIMALGTLGTKTAVASSGLSLLVAKGIIVIGAGYLVLKGITSMAQDVKDKIGNLFSI